MFKGGRHYKVDWDPDEYIPYSLEKMEKNRQRMRDQRMRDQIEENLEPTPYEEA